MIGTPLAVSKALNILTKAPTKLNQEPIFKLDRTPKLSMSQNEKKPAGVEAIK